MGWIVLALVAGCLCLVVLLVRAARRWLSTQSPYALLARANAIIARDCVNGPFVHRAAFPDAALLEAHWRVIADECAAVLPLAPRYGDVDPHQAATAVKGTWRVYMLRYMDEDVAANMAACPRTAALLQRCRGVRNAFFSILEAGTALRPHRGVIQSVLRYHLGLLVPQPAAATLTVGGVTQHWREGEGILWDDMYQHSAENAGTAPRVILFLDVVRSDLGLLSRAVDAAVTWGIRHNPAFREAVKRAEPAPSCTMT